MFRGAVSRQEWGAASPTDYNGEQKYGEGLVVHWEGPGLWSGYDLSDLATHERCFQLVRGIQAYHMSHGYSDIAYNDVACPHGYLFAGRSGVPMANAASGDYYINQNSEAVCALMGVGDPVTEDLLDAITALRNFLMWVAGLSTKVRPHRQVVATSCPGDDLTAWCASIDGTGAGDVVVDVPGGGEVPLPPAPPQPDAPAWPGRFFMPDSYLRGDDVWAWQARMAERGWAIDVDGVYGPQSTRAARAFQAEKGLEVDGIVGPMTWTVAWTAPIT